MAERPPHRPEHHARRDVRGRGGQAVRGRCAATRALMMLATGASLALWTMAQLDDDVRAREPIWLLVIITLTAWPSYFAWCSHQRTNARLAELEQQREAEYGVAYTDGYLDGLAAYPSEAAGRAAT